MPIQVVFFDLGDTLVTSTRTWQPGAKEMLAALSHQGFRLGVISNTRGLASRQAILNLLPIDFDLSQFESGLTLFSSEVGIEKPDRQIFDAAVAQAGISASRCFYCSENAVEALVAQVVGMRALRIVTGSSDLVQMQSYLSHIV